MGILDSYTITHRGGKKPGVIICKAKSTQKERQKRKSPETSNEILLSGIETPAGESSRDYQVRWWDRACNSRGFSLQVTRGEKKKKKEDWGRGRVKGLIHQESHAIRHRWMDIHSLDNTS